MKQSSPQIQHKPRLAIFNFFVLSILFFANYSGLPAQVTLAEGRKTLWNYVFRNDCKQPHRYRIKSEAKFFSFLQATDDIIINGNSNRTFSGTFDASGLKTKVYRDKLVVKCLDCKKDEGCRKVEDTVSIWMTVVSAIEILPTPIPTPTPTPIPIPTPTPTPIPTPTPLDTPDENRESSTHTDAPVDAPVDAPDTDPAISPPPGETPSETSPLNVSSPMDAPSATPIPAPGILQNPPSDSFPSNNNLILAMGFFAVAAVGMMVFVLISSILAKNLFNKWKYGNNAANLRALKKAKAAKEKLSNNWMKKRRSKNIHAIGVGKIGGTENYCIQVFVEDADGQMLENPPVHLLPAEYQNFPIFIFEMPRAIFMGDNYGNRAKDPHETIVGGISGANTNLSGETGTIGYFCSPTILRPIRKFRKEVYLLSNTHVFADLSKTEKNGNDLIQQPSPGENKRHNFIASLEKFVPIKFDNDTEDPNFADAAIAKLFPGKTHKLEIPDIGKITDYVPRERIELRTNCRKFGRTTGYTEGQIFSIHLSIWIKYGATGQESFFKEQFLIVPTAPHDDFVRGGDSGALVADHENKALGLIFAGAASNTNFKLEDLPTDLEDLIPNSAEKIRSFGVANPISDVMKSLHVKLMI